MEGGHELSRQNGTLTPFVLGTNRLSSGQPLRCSLAGVLEMSPDFVLKGFQVAGAGELGGQSGLAEVVTFL